jgi:aminopeptidase YwaD
MRNFLLIFFLLPLFSFAQVEHGRETVKMLCSPEFQGRGYVNGGDSLAAEFIAKSLKDAGCHTFSQGIFQPFQFKVNTFPNRMALKLDDRDAVPGTEFVVDPGSGSRMGTNLLVLQISPEEIMNPKLLKDKISAQNDKEGGRAKNKFGLLIYLPDLKGDTLKKAQQLAHELTATFPVIEVMNSKFTWSVEQTQSNYPLFQVQHEVLDMTLGQWKMSFTVDAELVNHTARNIIAYAPAKKKSKKYIIFTAHYDHLGRMGQDAYFPGGNDNASGVAMLIELANYYAKNPIDVNVVFIAFAGEEVGLLGSHYYVNNPIFPLEKIHFLFNLDIMGSGEEGVTIVNATLFPNEFKVLEDINKEKNYVAKIGSRGPAANSDHYFFTQKGVPAFFMYTMGPNKHYHDVGDTYEQLSFSEFNDLFLLLKEFAMDIPRKTPKKKK